MNHKNTLLASLALGVLSTPLMGQFNVTDTNFSALDPVTQSLVTDSPFDISLTDYTGGLIAPPNYDSFGWKDGTGYQGSTASTFTDTGADIIFNLLNPNPDSFVITGGSTVTATFLGKEAGDRNQFRFSILDDSGAVLSGPEVLFDVKGGTGNFDADDLEGNTGFTAASKTINFDAGVGGYIQFDNFNFDTGKKNTVNPNLQGNEGQNADGSANEGGPVSGWKIFSASGGGFGISNPLNSEGLPYPEIDEDQVGTKEYTYVLGLNDDTTDADYDDYLIFLTISSTGDPFVDVPEPATVGLLGFIGLAGYLGFRRFRAKKA